MNRSPLLGWPPDAHVLQSLETSICRDIASIGGCLPAVDRSAWEVVRFSWTGAEWGVGSPLPGCCFVEIADGAGADGVFLFVIDVCHEAPRVLACYERSGHAFELTAAEGTGGPDDGLPERLARKRDDDAGQTGIGGPL